MNSTPSFAEIEIRGRDAGSFLHSQLASEVAGLAPGQWRFGSYCQVDGRVQSLLMCARLEAECFRLLLPEDNCAEVVQRLLRFRIRAKCEISSEPVSIAAGMNGARSYACADFNWEIRTRESDRPALPQSLWSAQITLGVPWLTAPVAGKFMPVMLALERLQAFSLRKGCYPGQEILARTHYLGRSKRRLVMLRVLDDGQPAAGLELFCKVDAPAVGAVICAAASHVLAVVNETVTSADLLHAPTVTSKFVIDRNLEAEPAAGLLNGVARAT